MMPDIGQSADPGLPGFTASLMEAVERWVAAASNTPVSSTEALERLAERIARLEDELRNARL
jgi:hypothetical protein